MSEQNPDQGNPQRPAPPDAPEFDWPELPPETDAPQAQPAWPPSPASPQQSWPPQQPYPAQSYPPQPYPAQPYPGMGPVSGPLPGMGYPGPVSGPFAPGQAQGQGATSYPPYGGAGPYSYPPGYPGMPVSGGTMPGGALPPGAYPTGGQYPGGQYPAAPYPTGAPPYPGMPGLPSMPLGYPGSASMPPALGQPPGPYPTYPGYGPLSPTVPGGPLAPIGTYAPYPPIEEEPIESALARPFTTGMSVLLFVGAVAISLGLAAVAVAAFHADWSAGATIAGITALVLALVSAVVALIRVSIGRRARIMYALSTAMVLVLTITGISSLTFASPLHSIQATTLERNGQWADAIREYSYSGEGAPNAPNIARVYDEWGEQLLGQRSYGLAVSRFDTVVTQYAQSGSAYSRGRTDLYNAYKQWIGTQATDVPYPDAITYFETYAGFSTCDSACQEDAQTIEAQARFQYGTQLAASSNFADAITQFEAIQRQFPQSPYASQAHAAAAKAYYAEGQQQLSGSTCSNALTAYQTLVSKYGDTPEGQKAKAALAAGVDVTGTIPSAPKGIAVFLSKHADPQNFVFSEEYRSTLGTNGTFTFHGVQPGDYNLATSQDTGGNILYVYWRDTSDNLYFIHVGQLCPVQVTNLQAYS